MSSRIELCELEIEHQQIEAFRLLLFAFEFRTQPGDRVREFTARFDVERRPRLGFRKTLHQPPMQAHDEIVHVHRRDLGAQ